MSGILVPTPANGAADYTDFIVQMERLKKGFFNIEFTTLADGTTAPAIKAGSWIEVDGVIYKFTAEEAITGWAGITEDSVCYVKVIPDGSDITAVFTELAVEHVDLKNGWYGVVATTDRYVLWLYKSGADNYTLMRTEPEVTRNFKVTGLVELDSDLTIDGDLTLLAGGELTLPDKSIDLAHMNDDSVDGSKIKDDAINSEHITNGSVDREHLEADIIDSTKLANDAVNSEHYVNGSIDEAHLANSAVAQAKLKTSSGEVSVAAGPAEQRTLPGGQYGFYPQVKTGTGSAEPPLGAHISGAWPGQTYVTQIHLNCATRVAWAQQRYVTSSGEIHWIFILRDKITKIINSVWQAPDHPCFGNGGKPLLVSHPFCKYDKAKYEIIVLNPTKDEVKDIRAKCIVDDETKPDLGFMEAMLEYYEIDETSNPKWPSVPVTVGLPPNWEELPMGADIQPVRKVIPKPDYIKVKKLKIKV